MIAATATCSALAPLPVLSVPGSSPGRGARDFKRLGRWPRRFFSARVVGIGRVKSVSAPAQHQSRSDFRRGTHGRNHDSDRIICRCVSSTICRYASSPSKASRSVQGMPEALSPWPRENPTRLLQTASPCIDSDDHHHLTVLVVVGVLQRHAVVDEDFHFGARANEVSQKLGLLQSKL